MFAVVRTGGKQYRVAPGDKIVVEKLAGETGDSIKLDDILLAGEGSDLKSLSGLIVTAEIVAQAKSDKVTVFKKRRRHNYRRKAGHRQQLTILRITQIGDQKADKKTKPAAEKAPKPVPSKVEGAEVAPVKEAAAAPAKEAKAPAPKTEKPAAKPAAKAPAKAATKAEKPAAPKAAKPAPAKPAPAKAKSTKDAAPAKGASKTKTSKK